MFDPETYRWLREGRRPVGHVAYVESVNPDGSWVVTEMNFVAFDVISTRTIKPGQLGSRLVGFIY